MSNVVKTPAQIERIKKSGQILSSVLKRLKEEAKVGAIPTELDRLARELIEEAGGTPAFLGYQPDGADHPFPYTTCISLNNTIVHGRPSDEPLKDGDIISFDLGVNWQGGISDSAFTMIIGEASKEAKKLLAITEDALRAGIKQIKPGKHLGDIGYAIERVITRGGGHVMEGLGGHGVGDKVHEDPFIFNIGEKGTGMELVPGMVLAIEPMASMTTGEIIQLKDDSFATKDGSLSAHFEHTVLVTDSGNEVLTR